MNMYIEEKCVKCGDLFERSKHEHHEQRHRCRSCRDFRWKCDRKGKDYKVIAARIMNYEISRGRIPRISRAADHGIVCVDCGAKATGYDHRDYRKPLEIEPICHSCNCNRGPGLPYKRDAKSTESYEKRLKAAVRLVKAAERQLVTSPKEAL